MEKFVRCGATQSRFNIGELTGPTSQIFTNIALNNLALSISEAPYRHTLQSTRMLHIARGEEKDHSHQSCLKKIPHAITD